MVMERITLGDWPNALHEPDVNAWPTPLPHLAKHSWIQILKSPLQRPQESLFWDDPTKLSYTPNSELYPGRTDTTLWPSDEELSIHAKKTFQSTQTRTIGN